MRETFAAVEELMAEFPGGVSLSQIKAHLKLAHGSAQRRVDSLLKGGYLVNKELGGKGYAACYVIGDRLPANRAWASTKGTSLGADLIEPIIMEQTFYVKSSV